MKYRRCSIALRQRGRDRVRQSFRREPTYERRSARNQDFHFRLPPYALYHKRLKVLGSLTRLRARKLAQNALTLRVRGNFAVASY